MFGALLYLRLTSLQNWLRMRLLRLKQPKYLVGGVVGVLYFWFFFFHRMGASSAPSIAARRRAAQRATEGLQAAGVALPENLAGLGVAIGALVLLVIVVLAWVFSVERASLGFSEAEIAFLFPAPIARRQLVHFRLIDMQLRNLLGAVFMIVFTNRWTMFGGSPWAHAAGWWIIFTGLGLHLAGVRFTLTRLADARVGTWQRRLAILAAVAAGFGVTMALLPADQRWINLLAPDFSQELSRWTIAVTNAAPLAWLLWPAKLLVRPFLANDTPAFLLAIGPALLVLAAHYLWVVRSVVSFEDGSIERAQKAAAKIAAMRSGRRLGQGLTKGRRSPFDLAGTGRPEIAFLWKNLLGAWSWLNLRVWCVCALALLAAGAWAHSQPGQRNVLLVGGIAGLIVGGYTLLLGPQFARQDIRSDLVNTDLLKTYPLPGWQVVLGELLAPITILTGILWLALLAAALGLPPDASVAAQMSQPYRDFVVDCLSWPSRTGITLCLAAMMPPIVALQLFVPNAAALLFPAWFQTARQRGQGGIDVMGQRLLFSVAQMLTVVVALLPTAVAARFAVSVACFLFHLPALVGVALATVGVIAVLLVELWLGLQFLGSRFEKIDLSSELRP